MHKRTRKQRRVLKAKGGHHVSRIVPPLYRKCNYVRSQLLANKTRHLFVTFRKVAAYHHRGDRSIHRHSVENNQMEEPQR